jgi:hypothetical protein
LRHYPQVACTGALLGCLAGGPIACHAGGSSDAMADDGVVTVTGVFVSSPMARRAVQGLAESSSRADPGARRSADDGKAGLMPGTMEQSRTRWNGDSAEAVKVDKVAYRMAYGTSKSAVSVGVGAVGYTVRPGASVLSGGLPQPAAVGGGWDTSRYAGQAKTGTMPAISVAYTHAISDKYQLNLEATKASTLSSQLRDSLVTTKVGVEYSPARNSAFGLEQGSVSLKMSSNFAMKIRRGGPMFYMRSKF